MDRQRGRPSISGRGSEVFSIRVPKGTAAILRAGFKTISALADERAEPASVVLQAQLQVIEGLLHRNSVLGRSAIQGIRHTLEVIERSKIANARAVARDDAIAL